MLRQFKVFWISPTPFFITFQFFEVVREAAKKFFFIVARPLGGGGGEPLATKKKKCCGFPYTILYFLSIFRGGKIDLLISIKNIIIGPNELIFHCICGLRKTKDYALWCHAESDWPEPNVSVTKTTFSITNCTSNSLLVYCGHWSTYRDQWLCPVLQIILIYSLIYFIKTISYTKILSNLHNENCQKMVSIVYAMVVLI